MITLNPIFFFILRIPNIFRYIGSIFYSGHWSDTVRIGGCDHLFGGRVVYCAREGAQNGTSFSIFYRLEILNVTFIERWVSPIYIPPSIGGRTTPPKGTT